MAPRRVTHVYLHQPDWPVAHSRIRIVRFCGIQCRVQHRRCSFVVAGTRDSEYSLSRARYNEHSHEIIGERCAEQNQRLDRQP